MTTLRKFYAAVAPILGLNENSTRELGRAIYRIVDGVEDDTRPTATTLNTAHIVIGSIAGGTQRQAGDRVRGLFGIEVDGGIKGFIVGTHPQPQSSPKLCKITGAAMLGDAVFTILHSPELPAQIDRIEIQAGADEAWIVAKDGRKTHFFREPYGAGRPDVVTVSSIGGNALARICALVSVD
jgi:hypothetical protein